jgi:uncharacterized UBP type Zn finger protein
MTDPICSHLDQITVTSVPSIDDVPGCEECLRTGGSWVHLRVCLSCGKIGCCDSSPNQHATKHAWADSHPVLRSIERGEEWSWCVIDEVAFLVG